MTNLISDEQSKLFTQIVNCFEQGRKDFKYDVIYVYSDGPGNKRQLTLSVGITEYGNMKKLIQKYIASNGSYAVNFKKYVDQIGRVALVDDKAFRALLIESNQKDPIMRHCVDETYDEMYYTPAYAWFTNGGFTLPLSMLVIFDSFLQSGSILGFLRKRFTEELPNAGGDEKVWIKQYIAVRRAWLANHSRPILRGTVYRMDFMLTQIKNDNWDVKPPFVANDVKFN